MAIELDSLLTVNREGIDYKCTAEDFLNLLQESAGPEVPIEPTRFIDNKNSNGIIDDNTRLILSVSPST